MTIIYRTSGAWGSGKGSNLTPAEVDANFYDLDGRVVSLETNPPVPAEISNIVVAGTQVTFYLSNGSQYGPYTLPRSRFAWRGYWSAATAYVGNDVFRYGGLGVYLVLEPHTSASTFDPDAVNGTGEPLYAKMMDETAPIKTGAVSGAGVYSPLSTDAGKYITISDTGPITVDMDDVQYSVLPEGTEIHWRQDGFGHIFFIDGTATALNLPTGYAAETGYTGAVVTTKKRADGSWDLFGALALASTAT